LLQTLAAATTTICKPLAAKVFAIMSSIAILDKKDTVAASVFAVEKLQRTS
jgi:hypothetical protein